MPNACLHKLNSNRPGLCQFTQPVNLVLGQAATVVLNDHVPNNLGKWAALRSETAQIVQRGIIRDHQIANEGASDGTQGTREVVQGCKAGVMPYEEVEADRSEVSKALHWNKEVGGVAQEKKPRWSA